VRTDGDAGDSALGLPFVAIDDPGEHALIRLTDVGIDDCDGAGSIRWGCEREFRLPEPAISAIRRIATQSAPCATEAVIQ